MKTIREIKNCNFSINSKRILREVIDNIEVSWGKFSRKEKELVRQSVEATLWELFERKEERLREELDKIDKKWEFKK